MVRFNSAITENFDFADFQFRVLNSSTTRGHKSATFLSISQKLLVRILIGCGAFVM